MQIYNSLTFQKEEFKPIEEKKVKIYWCGPTVYESPHLGHMKSAVTLDLIHRYFKFKGFKVKQIKNYTDIDDKIIGRSKELNEDYKKIAEKYIQEYEEMMDALNILNDTKNPRATEVIPFIIEFIEKLIEEDHAYEQGGSVYFAVNSFPKYNTIMQNVSEEDSDEEEDYVTDQDTAYGQDKRDPRDFALWKKMKEGEPYWESPWGKGRPGWHIECSAMALNFLGETIDIHGGGQDLKFPHHRNEIAQSESYTGKEFAHYFVHNGFINVNDEKMSKSVGNYFLISEILKEYDPMVVRWFLLTSHYRSSINYSLENMEQAKKSYNRLINTIKQVNEIEGLNEETEASQQLIDAISSTRSNILSALDDDIDTPTAIAELLSLFRDINKIILEEGKSVSHNFKKTFFEFIDEIDALFGIFPDLDARISKVSGIYTKEARETIKNLIQILQETREELRKRKIFDLSDEIRNKLRELGIDIEDKKMK
ncbi:MAG: cysteine--tRNA ligase [Promethearchaeota archaeon]|nr:MAG: cysteine--tRNA ligase [Candidatus Lokiarchaeota archaeon]